MKNNMYYAVYDITNNSTRNSIIYILKNQGFVRIQKSVFCGSLSGQNKKDMTESIKSVVDKNDSFYLILTCNRCFGKIKIIGKGFDKEYVSDKKPAVVL
ncbi:MAG: CRISPR-associated endonuclease Cas2 [Nitrosopumilaceae archaeon]|nr:CRISPR-associated endonuclease Cas2 [Nitrosopumilaceae archaeon]